MNTTNRETNLVNHWCAAEHRTDIEDVRDELEICFYAMPDGCLRDMANLESVNWAALSAHHESESLHSTDDSFKGWPNRETWLVNKWYSPTSKSDLQWIRSELDGSFETLPDGCVKSMIRLNAVDWANLSKRLPNNECSQLENLSEPQQAKVALT